MEKKYENENRLIRELEKYDPDVAGRLNYPGNPTGIQKIEEKIGEELPKGFKDLYQYFDGEETNGYVGLILGFRLLDTESILSEISFFNENTPDMEMDSMNKDAISEKSLSERILVPFAFDADSCYIALDLTPGDDGKKGQIITLDFEHEDSYLLADSMEDFYDFILKMMEEKKCRIAIGDEDEKYFEFESGHLFNDLDELLFSGVEKADQINLPEEFWQERFKCERISVKELEKEKVVRINYDGKHISLAPLKYMENLKELNIYTQDTEIEDWEAVAELPSLKIIRLSCNIRQEQLELLCRLPKLKEIRFNKMDLKQLHIDCFADSKTIRNLAFYRVSNFNSEELAKLKKLQELSMDTIEVGNLEFLKNMKGMKKLEIEKVEVDSLDFLEYTKKLSEFKLEKHAKDENGLQFLPELKGLKRFEYPVADLSLYSGLEKLSDIGIDVKNMHHLECLKDTHISGAQFYGAESRAEVKTALGKIENYVKLYSYGYAVTWEEDDENFDDDDLI